MCKRWLATLVLILALAAPAAGADKLRASLDATRSAVLDENLDICLVVSPERGDAWTRLALRLTGDADQWKAIAEKSGEGPNLLAGIPVRVPLTLLKPSLQQQTIAALFPADRAGSRGWVHKVVSGTDVEGESLWKIAEWFTGDGANYAAIRSANNMAGLSTRRGDAIVIPRRLLSEPFLGLMPAADPSRPQLAEDDPQSGSSDSDTKSAGVAEATSDGGPISLEYHRSGDSPYAVYRLRRGEALYSSVGIRFTGRVYAKDVYDVVDQIVAFNGIQDVSKLPVGYAVKIPMELLTPEYRPSDDPRRLERDRAKKESARLARKVEAKNLQGVRIILDAGHGGRDVGTAHDGVWESIYVYDITCRVKTLLEKKSAARVWMTTSSGTGCQIAERDVLPKVTDHVVLTTPRYGLDDPVVGVNLRWYLANSIFRRALDQSTEPEKVIFLSIHADSLHPSLRGAMAYIPGERYVQGTFTKKGDVYLARAEVRENPTVTHSEQDALRAEGLSTDLASSIMSAFRKDDLKVHPYQPVRDNVVRRGKEWVPAVIRYNLVPTRMLLETCNLGNREDRRLMQTRKYRQRVAKAIYEGIVSYFADRAGDETEPTILQAAAK